MSCTISGGRHALQVAAEAGAAEQVAGFSPDPGAAVFGVDDLGTLATDPAASDPAAADAGLLDANADVSGAINTVAFEANNPQNYDCGSISAF
jgi:hypothetical protein